jgi:hypothetical protein
MRKRNGKKKWEKEMGKRNGKKKWEKEMYYQNSETVAVCTTKLYKWHKVKKII